MLKISREIEINLVNVLIDNDIISGKDLINIKKISTESNKSQIDAIFELKLTDEKKIIEQTNLKFKDENELLKITINNLNKQISDFKNEVYDQKQIIAQYNIDLDEIEFLRLNLKFGHTCRKSFLNNDGFEVGTLEYKSCVMNKGQTDE